MLRAAVVILASSSISACGKSEVRRAAPAPSASVAVPKASVDAGGPVDLLYVVPSLVAVSSRVDNPRDLPDFIVDRRPETAWNGRTGDLASGYVAFRVPKDAHVDSVDLTVGYDKKTEKEDLFTANVRIKSVRVLRDRKLLRAVTLDPDLRTPQRIPIDANGGDFKIEVTETVSGTKKEWRELVVSELAVWGTPGAKRNAKPTPPPVRVGGLDASTPTVEQPKRARTIEAACAAFESDKKISFDVAKAESVTYTNDDAVTGTFRCEPGSPLEGATSSFMTPLELKETDHSALFYNQDFQGVVLGVKTSSGAFATSVRLRGRETAWYWTADYTLLSIATVSSSGRDALVVQVLERRVTDSDGMGTPEELHSESVTHEGTVCELDARGQLACRTTWTPLTVKLNAEVKPAPTRTLPNGEVVFDVPNARR